jgi:hypothetical protein
VGKPSKRTKAYQECQQTRRKNPTVFIICEGEGEPVYLDHFDRRDRRLQIKVSDDKRADLVVQFAINLIESQQIDVDENDVVWCVFDRDDNSNENLELARHLAARYSIRIAYSNPCFEIWLYWHLVDSMRIWTTSKQLKSEIKDKNIIRNYHETDDYFDLLSDHQSKAIRMSEQARAYHERNGTKLYLRDSNPMTDFDILVKELNT